MEFGPLCRSELGRKHACSVLAVTEKMRKMLVLLNLHFDPIHSLISKYLLNFMVGTEVLNVAVLVAFFFVSSTVNRKPSKYTLL